MEMGTVQPEHKKLEKLAGSWIAEETLAPSPWGPGGPAVGKIDARVGLGGFYVIADYTQEKDGKINYQGHGIYGYDPKSHRYTMHWFDNMGMCTVEATYGAWEGDKLVFQGQSEQGHGRYTYTFLGDGRYEFMLEGSQDGRNWSQFMEGTYKRK
jgi:hypothetical protein